MYLVQMKPNAIGSFPSDEVERFFFILDGTATVAVNGWAGKSKTVNLHADQYAYVPYETKWSITSQSGGSILVYERVAAERKERLRSPVFQSGSVHDHPVLPVDGEMFVLRKLLPQTSDYFFNIHVMDFLPGEHLNVKEVHYNQHGLLLLAGKGIYRLGDEWMPVKAGDAIWMAPYIPQWYAALGSEPSRYIIYKDTIEDPVRARRP